METSLTNEQMKLFVEIIQMVALLDEAVEKYIAEYYSLCTDERTISAMMRRIKGLESACVEIQRILEENTALNKPRIEKMTKKFQQIKRIRNYIAHDRRLLVIAGWRNNFAGSHLGESFIKEGTDIQDMSLEELYKKASGIFNEFRDFLGQLYYEPDEEEYQVERRVNLYGK